MPFSSKKINIRYIANSGVLIANKEKKVLLDGLHITFVKPYFSVDDATLEQIILSKAPYDKIDLMLFTHHHLEHFDAYTVCETLKKNRFTQLIATPTITKLLKESTNFDPVIISQINNFEIPRGKSIIANIKNLPVEIIAMRHDGEKYKNIENFSYFFELGSTTFFHCGDSAPIYKNFEECNIFNKKIDILMVPFPFMGLREGRRIIEEINPKQLIVMHLPDKKHDDENYLFNTIQAYKENEKMFPQTDFLTAPGQEILIK